MSIPASYPIAIAIPIPIAILYMYVVHLHISKQQHQAGLRVPQLTLPSTDPPIHVSCISKQQHQAEAGLLHQLTVTLYHPPICSNSQYEYEYICTVSSSNSTKLDFFHNCQLTLPDPPIHVLDHVSLYQQATAPSSKLDFFHNSL